MKTIGVIGGVGPYAGLDFIRKIFDNTSAAKDQEHLDCVLVSCPSMVSDRTRFLLGEETENPSAGMFESAKKLSAAGASYAVVACNTAHAAKIFEPFYAMVQENIPGLHILNMIEICVSHIQEQLRVKRVGLLATKGTYRSKVYNEYFNGEYTLIEADDRGQEKIHQAIYGEEFGLKAFSRQVKPVAREIIAAEIERLVERGAEAIILGCTELPLATEGESFPIPLIDPAILAARALISLVAPEKLLPLDLRKH